MPCPSIRLKRFWNCPNSFGPFRTGPKNNFSLLNITFWTVSKCLFLSKTIWKGPKSCCTYTSKRHYSTVYIKTLKSSSYPQQINEGRGSLVIWIESQEVPTSIWQKKKYFFRLTKYFELNPKSYQHHFNVTNHFTFSDRPNRRRKVAHA